MSLVGRAPSITPVARRDRNKGGCSLSPDRVGKCCSHLAGIREISRRSAAPRLTPRHRAGFISDRLIGIGLLPLFSHLHTPPPFSPSLISLVVSVDVKHHVYLLMGLLPLFPPALLLSSYFRNVAQGLRLIIVHFAPSCWKRRGLLRVLGKPTSSSGLPMTLSDCT